MKRVALLAGALLGALMALATRRVRKPPLTRDERAVALLLGVATLGFLAFAVLVIAEPDTQALGLAAGGGLAALAAALGIAGTRLVPRVERTAPRPSPADGAARDDVRERVGLSRRRLLTLAAGAAVSALAAAVVAPVTALGPSVGTPRTPWRRGRRLVGEDGAPISADDIEPGTFLTAFPEGADRRELGAAVVLVRERDLQLPAGREDWAPEGILAYSKICTHAGCAVTLYRSPKYEPTSARPALTCPCHYSVFETRRGGAVSSGPAGRPLPQLPLLIGADRGLRAGGDFSGPVGPSWWNVRR